MGGRSFVYYNISICRICQGENSCEDLKQYHIRQIFLVDVLFRAVDNDFNVGIGNLRVGKVGGRHSEGVFDMIFARRESDRRNLRFAESRSRHVV